MIRLPASVCIDAPAEVVGRALPSSRTSRFGRVAGSLPAGVSREISTPDRRASRPLLLAM